MTTLKISDLSVGDWVSCEDVYCKVGYILPDGIIGTTCRNYRDGYEDPLTNLHPIPITAEILEKNGFTRCSDEFNIYEYTTLLGKMLRTTQVFLATPRSINVFVHDTTIERGFYHREKTSVSILRDELYVHDLQHAIRLVGLEKEINL